MKKRLNKIVIALVCVVIIWVIFGVVDYWRVCELFENPIFALGILTKTDCGCHSRTYMGIGYYFKVKGYFLPDFDIPGISHVEYYLFGINIKTTERIK